MSSDKTNPRVLCGPPKLKKKHHPCLTSREFGYTLLSIDPWLKESITSPLTAYAKARNIKRKRHADFDTPVYYKKPKGDETVNDEVRG